MSANYDADIRIFMEMRKHPWIPEHKVFIDGEIAKLISNPETKHDGERLKVQYDAKMTTYVAEHPEEFPVVVPVKRVKKEEEEVKEEITPKKKGRPSKKSSPK